MTVKICPSASINSQPIHFMKLLLFHQLRLVTRLKNNRNNKNVYGICEAITAQRLFSFFEKLFLPPQREPVKNTKK